jgi:hypothetical protein
MTRPNLGVTPNVMPVQPSSEAEIRHLPGDLAVRVYPDRFGRSELIERGLTQRQHVEYRQYLQCQLCGNTCAGTCSGS